MSSKSNKDDSIQLLELSERESVENAETESRIQSPTISKFKKKNKIDTPVIQSPNKSVSSSSKISDIFVVQQQQSGVKKLKPIPAPRTKIFDTNNTDEIKKSSETLDTNSVDIQSVFSSETQSYKERLKSRFLSIKKQAELSAIKKEKTSVKFRKKKSTDASDENLQKEDSVINSEISKHEKNRCTLHGQQQNDDDFFCKIYIDETKDTENIQSSEIISTDRKQSIDTFLDIDFESSVVEFLFPENSDISLYEKELFQFWKKYKKVDTDLHETRNVEEEGIYQETNNHITKTELEVLENRLRYDEKEWFDTNGKLKILPDPRLDHSYKPFPTKLTHNDFVNNYTSPLLYIPNENYTNLENNTLEIAINNIRFRHHSLFSAEHVIAQKLIALCEEYKKNATANLYMFYRKKLDALRFAKNRLEANLGASGDSNEDNNIKHLNKYLNEIKIFREKMYVEARKERTIKLLILNIWKSLKNIREKQKYSNTNVKLNIMITNTNLEEETETQENSIKEEVDEIFHENETLYEFEMNEYMRRKLQWKEKIKQMKEIDDKDANSQGDTPSTTTYSSELLEEKPKKPKRNYSLEQIENEVMDKCKQCLKPPGEPIIEFEINYTHPITENVENTKEKFRRSVVNKTHVFMKILYGKREICKTKIIPLNESFICTFDEFISVKMFNNPEELTVQIYEQINPINKRMLSTINIQIPPFNSSISSTELIQQSFTNKELFNYNNTGVGTGIDLTDILKMDNFEMTSENNECKLYLTGVVSYKIGWDVVNLELCQNQVERQLFPTIFDIEDLEEWIQNYPDPQDPKNIMFFDFIQQLSLKNNETSKDYFRCDPDMEAFEFCAQDEIDNNRRFKLLKLRNQNDPEFRNTPVPIREKEISIEIFKNFDERRKEQRITTEMFGVQYQKENIDVQRKWANKFLAQTENRIIELSKTAETRICLKDVLNEDIMPTVGSLGSSIMNWFQPKRPLRPVRKQVKQIATGVDFKDVNILINILGAIHVPARKEYTSSKNEPQMNRVCVRPFVTVSFRDVCARTSVADGPNPVWNQEIILPIRNKTESITIASLQNIKDTIKINLYDETVDDLIVDDRLRERNIHQQLGCNWLGNFEFPFKTLLYSNRIEGSFKINLPPILLGYEQQTIRSFHTTTESVSQNIDTFVSVFITLQPTMGKLEPLMKCGLESNESLYIEEHITNWHEQYKTLFPQRYFSPFVTTMNGEKCCITRYLRPIKLPPLNSNLTETTEDQIAKYVSLIPFRENSATGLISDIWLTAEQLLTVMMGSINDHAILLTCYLMSLGLKCWLILGYGLPYGYAAYVLVRKKEHSDKQKKYFIYDVKTGQKYSTFENTCPLQSAFCAVSDENLWGNIQSDDRLHLTKFSFRKGRDWLPLFDCDISAPTSTFNQIDPVYYDAGPIVYLQEKIERKLKKKIMDMRKHSMTTWNFHSNIAFKKILCKLEDSQIRQIGCIESPEHLFELQDLFKTYQIRGFAQHFRYTTIKDLLEFIHSCGIYLNDQPNLEFSLACYARAYCNNAIIVWLYVATLLRKI